MTLCQSTGVIATQRDCLENSKTPVSSSFTATSVSDCFPRENDNLSSACEGTHDVASPEDQRQELRDNIKDEFNKINDEKLNAKITDIQDGLPVDRGWAWVIMIANFMISLTLGGYGCSLSIFFLEFQIMFNASVTTATITFALMTVAFGVGNLLVTNVLMTSGNTRKLTLVGACLSAVSITLSSFSPTISFLIICHTIMGFSHAMIVIPSITLQGHYFKTRRSFATAVGNTGGSVAGMVFPLLVQYLISSYGPRGAILLSGGINMQAIVAACLLRPVVFYKKFSPNRADKLSSSENLQISENHLMSKRMKCEDKSLTDENHATETMIETSRRLLVDGEQTVCSQEKQEDTTAEVLAVTNHVALKLNVSDNRHNWHEDGVIFENCEISPTFSDNSGGFVFKRSPLNSSLYSLANAPSASLVDICRSNLNLSTLLSPQTPAACVPDDTSGLRQTIFREAAVKSLRRRCVARFLEIMNFSLMRNWMFRLILTYQTLGFTVGFVGLYFPSLAVRNGLSREDAALLISVIGGVDLFSKLTSGLVADVGCIRRTHLVAIALVITSVACHFTRFYTTFSTLALFAVVFGLFAGVCPNLSTVVIIDLLGLEHLGKSMGLFLVVNSIFATANHPLIGAMVETTGSMILPFHYIGICVFLGAILLLLEPCARRLEERRMRVEMARTSV